MKGFPSFSFLAVGSPMTSKTCPVAPRGWTFKRAILRPDLDSSRNLPEKHYSIRFHRERNPQNVEGKSQLDGDFVPLYLDLVAIRFQYEERQPIPLKISQTKIFFDF